MGIELQTLSTVVLGPSMITYVTVRDGACQKIFKCLKNFHKRSMRKILTFRNSLTQLINSQNDVTCTLSNVLVLLLLIFLFFFVTLLTYCVGIQWYTKQSGPIMLIKRNCK